LGKGATQVQAIEEISAFPENHPLRNRVEGLLGRWRIYVTEQSELTTDDEALLMNLSKMSYDDEFLMNLSKIYKDLRERSLRKGRQEGRQ
jgi:hypothetical protein